MLIAQYELLGRVSQTATGSVWKGWDNTLQREVALKQVSAPSVVQWEQLRAEASTLAGLQQENIVSVYDLIEQNEDAWLIQEWVDGATLSTISRHNRNLTPQQGLSIVRGALQGLSYAHQQQIVHGDVTPFNILVDMGGVSKLIDFGLAGRWGTPSLGGTPGFASPEALEHSQLAPTSDVYSAAVVLAGVFLDKPLFDGPGIVAILAQQRLSPDLADLPPSLHQVLSRALAVNPGERQGDASILLMELEDAVERTYGPAWAVVGGVAGIVTATMAAVAPAGQAGALGTSAVAGAASATGSTASVATSTASGTSNGIGSGVTGLGNTGASDAGINFVSDLSNTTGTGAAGPEIEVSILKSAAPDSAGTSPVEAGTAAPATSIMAKPMVLVATAAAVVVIVVAAVFLFGGSAESDSPSRPTETLAGALPLTSSESEIPASTNSSAGANQTSTAATSSTSSSTTASTSTSTSTKSAAVLPGNAALGFSGVYTYSLVVIDGVGAGLELLGLEQTETWEVTTTCDESVCTALVNSSSGDTYNLVEAGGEWAFGGTEFTDCIADDTGEPIGSPVPHSWERTLRVTSSTNGHFEQLQGEGSSSQTERCAGQVEELWSLTIKQTLTYLGPEAVMTPDPTPVVQTS